MRTHSLGTVSLSRTALLLLAVLSMTACAHTRQNGLTPGVTTVASKHIGAKHAKDQMVVVCQGTQNCFMAGFAPGTIGVVATSLSGIVHVGPNDGSCPDCGMEVQIDKGTGGYDVNCDDPANAATSTCVISQDVVAYHPGGPVQGMGCNQSLNVGDNLGQIDGQTQSVADLNTIAMPAPGIPITGTPDQGVAIDTIVVAYVYKDTNHNYWIQRAASGSGVSVSFGPVAVTLPSDFGAHYFSTDPNVPTLPAGSQFVFQKCFDQGMNLQPINGTG